MRVFGLVVVRDEDDIIEASIRHHLWLGCERVLVVDNGSTDGTTRILRRLAREGRVRWQRDGGAYEHSQILTGLAREAARRGARWLLPFDADELWWAPGGRVLEVLAGSDAAVLRAPLVNFVQRRNQRRPSPGALLHMTYRAAAPMGLRGEVEGGRIAFVEMQYPRKVACRASPTVTISEGNHGATGLGGAVRATTALRCLHAPLRSRATLVQKAARWRRMEPTRTHPDACWHVARWSALADAGRLDEEWAANSHAGGALTLPHRSRRLVYDPTLHDLLARWAR